MPFATIPAEVIPLTVGGDSSGNVTVAVTSVPKVGTTLVLYSAGAGGLECIVVASNSSTGVVGLKAKSQTKDDHKQLNYGRTSNLTAWTVAGGSVLLIEKQDIPVQPLYRGQA